MTMIVPGAHEPAHRFISAPAKALPASAPSAFADYLVNAASTAMPERQSAWSFGESGVFGHTIRLGAGPDTAAAGVSAAEPTQESVSELPGTATGVSQPPQSDGISGVSAVPDFSSITALSPTDFTFSKASPLRDESPAVIQTDMPEAKYEPLHQTADENQAERAESSHERSFVQARSWTKNTSDIGLAVCGTGKFLQISAFGDGLGVDARMRLRKMLDAALEQYGHASSSLYVNGRLQEQPPDGSFTSIIQANIHHGGTDGDHRG